MRRVRACAAPERWLGSGAGGRKVGNVSRRTPRSHARATACSQAVTGRRHVVCLDRNGLCNGYRAHVAVTVPVTADLVAHRQRRCPPRLIRSGFGVGGGRAAPSRAAHRMQRSATHSSATQSHCGGPAVPRSYYQPAARVRRHRSGQPRSLARANPRPGLACLVRTHVCARACACVRGCGCGCVHASMRERARHVRCAFRCDGGRSCRRMCSRSRNLLCVRARLLPLQYGRTAVHPAARPRPFARADVPRAARWPQRMARVVCCMPASCRLSVVLRHGDRACAVHDARR